jgi:hypothetical protein
MEARAQGRQGKFAYDNWYQNRFFESLEKTSSKAFEGNYLKQMASKQPISEIVVVVQPKTKRKYKIEKEKEKDIAFEELATLGETTLEDELLKDEVQNLRDLVEEEAIMSPPQKIKKEKGKDGAGLNKASAQEKTLSPIAQSKGGIEASMASPIMKPPMAPKKNKIKEKVHEPSKKLSVHVDLHSFEEFNKKGDSLLGANEDIMDQTYPLG